MDGLTLTNTRGAAISVQKSFDKKRVFLNVLKGTENALCDAENYTDTVAGEDDKGCLFSEGKLILMGEGKLSVTGNYAHAIAADDRIHIHRGVQLYVLGAPKDGIHVKDELVPTVRAHRVGTDEGRQADEPYRHQVCHSHCPTGSAASNRSARLLCAMHGRKEDGFVSYHLSGHLPVL